MFQNLQVLPVPGSVLQAASQYVEATVSFTHRNAKCGRRCAEKVRKREKERGPTEYRYLSLQLTTYLSRLLYESNCMCFNFSETFSRDLHVFLSLELSSCDRKRNVSLKKYTSSFRHVVFYIS